MKGKIIMAMTRIEKLREDAGEFNGNPVFQLPSEGEALFYTRELFREKVKRAETDAKTIISHIEGLLASGKDNLQEEGRLMYRNTKFLRTFCVKYGLNEWQAEYCKDMVQNYFFAKAVRIQRGL
jgi:hypothetical protein